MEEFNPSPFPGLILFLDGFENSLHDFRMKGLHDMERQNNSSLIYNVDSMAAFAPYKGKSGLKQ